MRLPDPDRAQVEVREFFRKLGLAEGADLDRVVDDVLLRCAALRGVSPASVAGWLLTDWVARAVGLEAGSAGAPAARAAVLLADAARRWPAHLLSDGPLPEDLTRELRATLPQPVPRSLPLAMPEQPLTPARLGLPFSSGWAYARSSAPRH